MTEGKTPGTPKEPRLPADQRGVDAGTWGLIILVVVLTLAVLAWAAYGDPLRPPPERID